MDNSNEIYQLQTELDRNYADEQFRLGSFGPWFNNEVDKKKLARAGFFYLSERDHVKCVFCEVQIGGWMRGDNPFVEHKRHAPNCPFINGDQVYNMPIPENKHLLLEELAKSVHSSKLEKCSAKTLFQTARHPIYAEKTERLKSFVNWPTSLKQTPEELSDAGFFYLGVGDEVKCFYCGGCLRNFDSSDDALNEHKKHFFDRCKFIQLTYKNLKSSTYKLENRRPIKATNEQIQYLVEYLKQNENLHTGSLLQERVACTQMWKDLTKTLNDLGGATKEVKGWREVWRNYKYSLKRKSGLIENMIIYVETPQIKIPEKSIEHVDGSNPSPGKESVNYTNIDVQNANISPQPTIYTLVSDVIQDDILDNEIMQLQLKIEEHNLEIEKLKLELDTKTRQKHLVQKQNELQNKWHKYGKI